MHLRAHADPIYLAKVVNISTARADIGYRGPRFSLFTNLVANALGVTPKSNGKFRVVLDLIRPIGQNVNDYIDNNNFLLRFCGIDDAVRLVLKIVKAQ